MWLNLGLGSRRNLCKKRTPKTQKPKIEIWKIMFAHPCLGRCVWVFICRGKCRDNLDHMTSGFIRHCRGFQIEKYDLILWIGSELQMQNENSTFNMKSLMHYKVDVSEIWQLLLTK